MPCIYRVLKLSHLKLTALCQIEMWFSPGTLKLGAGASPTVKITYLERGCHQDRDEVPTHNPVWTGSHAYITSRKKVYVAKALFKMGKYCWSLSKGKWIEEVPVVKCEEGGWVWEMTLLTLISLGPRGTSRSLMGPGTWHVPWSRDIGCSRTYWMLNKQLLCE